VDPAVRRSAVKVTNFPVAAGDTVAMTVCAPQPDYGFVTMTNVTRNQGTSVGLQARPGITSTGGSAEWVLESSAQSPVLPAFRPITFTDCYGGSSTESFHLLPGPAVVNITSTQGNALTATRILSDTSAEVSWLAFAKYRRFRLKAAFPHQASSTTASSAGAWPPEQKCRGPRSEQGQLLPAELHFTDWSMQLRTRAA
jgi:hypothetical protein